MSKVVRLPTPDDRARTFRDLARARWRYAVERKLAGDEDGYVNGLEDVRALDEQAEKATLRATRIEIQQAHFERQRLELAAAIDGIFGAVERRRIAEAVADSMGGRPPEIRLSGRAHLAGSKRKGHT